MIPHCIGGEEFDALLPRLRLKVQFGKSNMLAERRKDYPLPVRGDIQLGVVALTGGDLLQAAAVLRRFSRYSAFRHDSMQNK